MKINESQRIGVINQYQRNTDARQGSIHKKSRLDEVSISPEAKEMLDAQARAVDPEHAKRIADLKQAVATGTYRVDANKIAEKLLPYFRN